MNNLHYTSPELMAMEQRERANLINSITGFKALALIGTVDLKGQTNLAIFNSLVHIGAHPPLLGFICRPDSVERHTLDNIQKTGYYTINHVHKDFYQKAHQTSARYNKDQSEFEATGLNAIYKHQFLAPFVNESNIQIGMHLKEEIVISSNNTIMIIGEMIHIEIPKSCLTLDGFLDIERAGTITVSGLDSYHTTTRISRLSYAKPDKEIIEEPLIYKD